MARIPDDELERLKSEISLERLCEARGVKLARRGKDLVGLCPFHEEKTPSFKVSPAKNVFHCMGCGAGGSVVDFVMKLDGISFRHAVELLRSAGSSLAALPSEVRHSRGRQEGLVPKQSCVRKLAAESGFARAEGDDELLARVVEHYQASLKDSPSALGYLAGRGLGDRAMHEHFKLGFSDRTLGYRLPTRLRKDGAELRGRLQALGVLRESGHEHFRGSVVVPITDESGRVVQMYGRKIDRPPRGMPSHLYLPGPERGVFNLGAFEQSREIILCEAIFDALSFWCAGYRHVTATYGAQGFTESHREALRRHETERVFIAFDRDKAGDEGAARLAPELAAMGIEVFRVLFPHGMDANEFAQKLTPADKALGAALRSAEWMAGTRAASRSAVVLGLVTPVTESESSETESAEAERVEADAAATDGAEVESAEAETAASTAQGPATTAAAEASANSSPDVTETTATAEPERAEPVAAEPKAAPASGSDVMLDMAPIGSSTGAAEPSASAEEGSLSSPSSPAATETPAPSEAAREGRRKLEAEADAHAGGQLEAAPEPGATSVAREADATAGESEARAPLTPSLAASSVVAPAPVRRPATARPPSAAAGPATTSSPGSTPATTASSPSASATTGAAVSAPSATAAPSTPRARLDAQGDVELDLGARHWRIRGLGRNKPGMELRVKVLLRHGAGFFVDTLELYSARQRAHFVAAASEELGLDEGLIKKDLGVVLFELERLGDEAAKAQLSPKAQAPEMSEADRDAALALLRSPRLVPRILEDIEKSGVVGERTNKLLGYLAATSRKLDEPLAVVIQSSSAAGKSSLMDAVLALVPEEERVQYSAMTGQSLFYMGAQDLKHKVLAIVEEEGAERASYALKLLQSEGELTIASTGKDPVSGKLITHEYRVEGPVMIMLTTTAIDVDEELLNRCIVLTVDEGREQTRAIHARQRRAQTLEGLLERQDRGYIAKLHQNAQRLIEPLLVVNPHAERLAFADHRTRTRRDHMKYLTLMRTIALLHQHQRPIRTVEHRGRTLRYVEVEESDIALATRLCEQVLLREIDELPPQTRRLFGEVVRLARELAAEQHIEPSAVRFSRRQLRERTGWGMTQLKVHLRRLEELELVELLGGGARRRMLYALALDYDANWAGQNPNWAGSLRGLGGGGSRPDKAKDAGGFGQLGGSGAGMDTGGNGAAKPGRGRTVAPSPIVASGTS